MRYTPDGVPVTSFSLATTKSIGKERGGQPVPCPNGWKESYNGRRWELTTWWRVTCWRGLAETVNNYLSKGRQVYVEGEVSGDVRDGQQWPRIYEANDGTVRASNYEITASTVKFLGGRDDTGTGMGAPIGEPPPEGFEEDALPF
jgi:single-strand DNA-binding protein